MHIAVSVLAETISALCKTKFIIRTKHNKIQNEIHLCLSLHTWIFVGNSFKRSIAQMRLILLTQSSK